MKTIEATSSLAIGNMPAGADLERDLFHRFAGPMGPPGEAVLSGPVEDF
jgi:hypothetical protein